MSALGFATGVDADPGLNPVAYCSCGWSRAARSEFIARRMLAEHVENAHVRALSVAAGSTRIESWVMVREPFASREACVNGHAWTTATTRWRRRTHQRARGSYVTVERDCLVCKRVSEAKRKKSRMSERRYM